MLQASIDQVKIRNSAVNVFPEEPKINKALAEHDANINGQYLKPNETVGYVITDINKAYIKELISALKKIEYRIKFRVLY